MAIIDDESEKDITHSNAGGTFNVDSALTVDPEPVSLAGKKVLIIEDDVLLGDIMVKHMTHGKMDVTLAPTAEIGMEYLKKQIPHILLLDLNLPGMHGLELLEMIRKEIPATQLPVLIVSNTIDTEDQEKSKRFGAEFLIKASVTPSEIVSKMEKMVSGKK